MISNRFRRSFIIRALLLTVTTAALVAAVIFHLYYYLLLVIPVLLVLWRSFYQHQVQAQREVAQFTESVQYHDFSRRFNENQATGEWRSVRRSFNKVFDEVKNISIEKEKHYQYIHKILELVDTGIISFESRSGEVVWINESLKKLLRIPNLKQVDALSKRHPELYGEIAAITPGNQAITSIGVDRSRLKILLSATVFDIDGKIFKVIAIQNVQEALDETESKAWQKLLSVLTHEIMNSVAPISSVAKTLNDLMMEVDSGENDHLPVEDIRTGLDTIKRRSEGLLRFSETYRHLSKITSLNIDDVDVRELFNGLVQLMKPSMHQKKIALQVQLESDDVLLKADANLVEQVLINLVMNATEAVKDRQEAKILLAAKRDASGKMQLSVSDNGTGISPELMDSIFIPFFSTRKHGTGIGLSLCKQIMLLHKGSVQVKSIPGTGTTFILQFA